MWSVRNRSRIFYLVLAVTLVVVTTKALTHVLPAQLAHEIDDESEALPIAFLFCAYIQFVRRPQLERDRSPWPLAIGVAGLCWVVAWALVHFSFPGSLATLNESFVAVGAMALYACLPRPFRWAPVLTVIAIALLVLLQSNSFVTDQAESLVPIALLPISLDWADRTILEPGAAATPMRRATWCIVLVMVPVLSRFHLDVGSAHDVLHYPRRATEGFVGLLLIHLYFAYVLRPGARSGEAADPRSSAPPMDEREDAAPWS